MLTIASMIVLPFAFVYASQYAKGTERINKITVVINASFAVNHKGSGSIIRKLFGVRIFCPVQLLLLSFCCVTHLCALFSTQQSLMHFQSTIYPYFFRIFFALSV